MVIRNNAIDCQFTNNATGFTIGGGTTSTSLTIAGNNFGLTSPSTAGSLFTLPALGSDTLIGYTNYPTTGSILYASAANTPTALAIGASGTVLTSNGTTVSWGAVPFANLSLISTGVALGMSINTAYQVTGSSSVTLTLPAVAAAGSVIRVANIGTGGFVIAQNAGQTMHFGTASSTTGALGSIASTAAYDSLSFYCSLANTDWVVTSSIGNLSVT